MEWNDIGFLSASRRLAGKYPIEVRPPWRLWRQILRHFLLAIELRQSVCSTFFDHVPPQASLVRVGRI
jgi:hypothetical protein